MSIANVIIAAIILGVVFWILHIYSVRRAQFLVKLQLESKNVETTNAVLADQTVISGKDSKNKQTGAKIESYRKKRKDREKSPALSGEKQWAIKN